MKFHALIRENAQELAELIVKENGKNITEALADGKEFALERPMSTSDHCPSMSVLTLVFDFF